MQAGLNLHRAGSGEPLVLLHGIGSNWQVWLPVLSGLEARHEVFAFDLPGFGESPQLPADVRPTVPALADAVERELDRLELERPHLAGNSLGGWLVLELARRGRARSVVALSPAGMWTSREAAFARAQLRATYRLARAIASRAELLTRTPARRTAILSLVSSRPWRIDPDEARHALESLGRSEAFPETLTLSTHDMARGMDAIEVPVTIAWGTRDRLLLPRQGPRFARVIPGAEHRPLRGAGHVPMWDDPELVTQTILEPTAAGERVVA